MFDNIDWQLWIILPSVFILVIVALLLRSRINKDKNPLNRALSLLKLNTIVLASFLLCLWIFVLPRIPTLSSEGYPQTVESLQSPQQLLEYLQIYNRALVRTTIVLFWFIFVFVAWFLSSLYNFSKAVTAAILEKG